VASVRVDYSPDLITEKAIDFIRNNKDHPFFLYYAPTIPHANNEAGRKGMEVPDLGPYKDLDWPEPQKAYAAMVTRLDLDVGRIVKTIQDLGLEDRTLIMFTSDNGPHAEGGNDPNFNDSNGPLRGIKRDLYEGGIRLPLIITWPGRIRPGQQCDRLVWFADILPTCAQLARASIPEGLDGVSIADLLFGTPRADLDNRHLYWEFHERGFARAIRKGRWKLIDLGPDRPVELYDLQDDPSETRDLAEQYSQIALQLHRLMAMCRTDTPDWPIPTQSKPER
jgi:arylsulfatase A-like enzyme